MFEKRNPFVLEAAETTETKSLKAKRHIFYKYIYIHIFICPFALYTVHMYYIIHDFYFICAHTSWRCVRRNEYPCETRQRNQCLAAEKSRKQSFDSGKLGSNNFSIYPSGRIASAPPVCSSSHGPAACTHSGSSLPALQSALRRAGRTHVVTATLPG